MSKLYDCKKEYQQWILESDTEDTAGEMERFYWYDGFNFAQRRYAAQLGFIKAKNKDKIDKLEKLLTKAEAFMDRQRVDEYREFKRRRAETIKTRIPNCP